jgi:hypothetical protein
VQSSPISVNRKPIFSNLLPDLRLCIQTPDPDNSHYICNVTFNLTNRGQITTDGIVNFADAQPVIAIVGGTGEFRGATGEFDFTGVAADAPRGPRQRQDRRVLEPVRPTLTRRTNRRSLPPALSD